MIFLGCNSEGKEYKVYFLGGQSNMEGYGKVADLPDDLKSPIKGVMIFNGDSAPDNTPINGRGLWEELRPGHGSGFSSSGEYNTPSDHFGIELSFARRMHALQPDINLALIKYSRGGTSLNPDAASSAGCWEPDFIGETGPYAGVSQYDHCLATIRNAFSVLDIDGDGAPDKLIPAGIIWMQGESDAMFTLDIAEQYQANLKRIIDLIRAALRVDDLPVVIGRISDSGRGSRENGGKVWPFGDVVRAAQAAFVAQDPAAALVTSTDQYGYSDPFHYDSEGYIDLGERFADAITSLESR